MTMATPYLIKGIELDKVVDMGKLNVEGKVTEAQLTSQGGWVRVRTHNLFTHRCTASQLKTWRRETSWEQEVLGQSRKCTTLLVE